MRTFSPFLLPILLLVLLHVSCSGDRTESTDIHAKTVRAETFELVDQNDHARALIEMEDGEPRFVLIDSLHETRVEIRLDDIDNPVLNLFDSSGARRAGFEFANGLNPALFLRDGEGRLKAGMQIQSEGSPLLFLRNSQLEDGFAVTMIEGSIPVMALSEPSGARRVFLGLENIDHSGSMIFVGPDGEVQDKLPKR